MLMQSKEEIINLSIECEIKTIQRVFDRRKLGKVDREHFLYLIECFENLDLYDVLSLGVISEYDYRVKLYISRVDTQGYVLARIYFKNLYYLRTYRNKHLIDYLKHYDKYPLFKKLNDKLNNKLEVKNTKTKINKI